MLLTFHVHGRKNLPDIINFFVSCAYLQKVTELIRSKPILLENRKHIFLQIFVKIDPHLDYTIRFCGLIVFKFTAFELEYKKLLWIAITDQEQTKYSKH